jgi:NADH-quinone oxidoreductase subunit G
MATITIDGHVIEVTEGEMLLPAALENGFHVPHYCWHPKLSIDGNCRMCQVEIEGAPKLSIACNTPVRDGMVVRTDTPAVANARRGVIELYLVNHPLDCPICDKAGECVLQDYSYAYGSRRARTREPRRKLEKRKDVGPRMILDQERCILCRRCVRFCREITHSDELAVFGIGDRSVLDALEDKPLANDYSICTADICPVGALESKSFHHKLRVWFLTKTESVCSRCANGCNITVQHYRNRIWRLMPRRNDAVNDTWMCDHGRLDFDFVHSPQRLRRPRLGRGDAQRDSDWEAAITAVATELQRYGGARLGAVASPHLTNEENFRFAVLLRALETRTVALAVCRGPADDLLIKEEKAANARGARDLGLDAVALDELLAGAAGGQLDALFVCGSDLGAVADETQLARALDAIPFLVVQDVAASPLSRRADVVLPSLTFAEKEGTFTNHAGRVQRLRRALRAPEQPDDGEIFTRLLRAVGEEAAPFDADGVLGEINAAVPLYAGATPANVGAHGWQLPVEPENPDSGKVGPWQHVS